MLRFTRRCGGSWHESDALFTMEDTATGSRITAEIPPPALIVSIAIAATREFITLSVNLRVGVPA